jgi:hypothetical protein
MIVTPLQIMMDSGQLSRAINASAEFGYLMQVAHKTSRNRATSTTLQKDRIVVPISTSDLMRWAKRGTPEMLWLRKALSVPGQTRRLTAFIQHAELFFRGAWTLPTWRKLRIERPPGLPSIAGIQIFVNQRNFAGCYVALSPGLLFSFEMFVRRILPFTNHTNGFEMCIRGLGPIVHQRLGEEGPEAVRKVRTYFCNILRNGSIIWRGEEHMVLSDTETG